jgi:putative tryptophan/tyrosine transport system substrate-binding protein
MRRREFITLVGGATLAWPLAAHAQEPGRTYSVGGVFINRNVSYVVAALDELRRFGFIEGQNLTIDWRSYGPRVDLIPEFVAELVNAKVDVIYVTGESAIRAAQRATTTIPILGATADLVGSGLVNSLAQPNGNTTGISLFGAELDGKRQEILIEAVPELRHMAALVDSNTTSLMRLQILRDAARARNVELTILKVKSPQEIPEALATAKASGVAALNVTASSLVLYANRQIIMQRVAALRLPAIYSSPEQAEEGGLVAYGARLVHVYQNLIAPQLAKLLRGAKPSDVPIEQPTKFELVINLKTAKALGLTIPESFLLRADKVIE